MALAAPSGCLFRGTELTEETRTQEHVFPRWLQERCGIANRELELANGTAVRYAQLLVPACAECNGVHASQLESRVADRSASPQEMWLWMLKIQLGVFYWESGKPLSRDRRSEQHVEPIFPLDSVDFDYFQTLFSALKGSGATFDPDPSGTLLSFPDSVGGFDYADRLYRHPRAPDDVYSAGLIAFDGRLWIALFDDGRRVTDHFIDEPTMQRQVSRGRDPRAFLPELMYTRSRIRWHPKVLVGKGSEGHTSHVVALPTMSTPHIFDFDEGELRTFYPVAREEQGPD